MFLILILFFISFQFCFAQLQITEVMYNPEGNDENKEWVEIINTSNNYIEIKGGKEGWRINDGKNHIFKENLTLAPGEIFIIAKNKNAFLNFYPYVKNKLTEASISLKNKGGKIQIINENEILITEINYEINCGGNGNGYSLIFIKGKCYQGKVKGGNPGILEKIEDLFTYNEKIENKNNLINDLNKFNFNTSSKEESNLINEIYDQLAINRDHEAIKNEKVNNDFSNPSKLPSLIISEFLPNPIGGDKGKEFIEIFNNSNEVVNLEDILLKVGSKKINLQGSINPKQYAVFYNQDYNFSIKNKGDKISIFFKDQELFSINYQGKAPQGKSFARLENNLWQFTQPTPGRKNIYFANNKNSTELTKQTLPTKFKDNFFPEDFLRETKANLNFKNIFDNYFFLILLIIFVFSAIVAFFIKKLF